MSEELISPERIVLTKAANGTLPRLMLKVLVETRDGAFYTAVRYENPAQKGTYFWGIPWRNHKGIEGIIGKMNLDVVAWYS